MLYVCVGDVMDVMFSVYIVMCGARCRRSYMGSKSVLSCRCCMFVTCVHPVAVLNAVSPILLLCVLLSFVVVCVLVLMCCECV